MPRKKSKPVSFDGMVKFFLQYYNIPTKKDIDKIADHLTRLEQMMKALSNSKPVRSASSAKRRRVSPTASDMVLAVIKQYKNGVDISQIQAKTGFEEKKLRNIIYRLNKTGQIRRKNRGIYIV